MRGRSRETRPSHRRSKLMNFKPTFLVPALGTASARHRAACRTLCQCTPPSLFNTRPWCLVLWLRRGPSLGIALAFEHTSVSFCLVWDLKSDLPSRHGSWCPDSSWVLGVLDFCVCFCLVMEGGKGKQGNETEVGQSSLRLRAVLQPQLSWAGLYRAEVSGMGLGCAGLRY